MLDLSAAGVAGLVRLQLCTLQPEIFNLAPDFCLIRSYFVNRLVQSKRRTLTNQTPAEKQEMVVRASL